MTTNNQNKENEAASNEVSLNRLVRPEEPYFEMSVIFNEDGSYCKDDIIDGKIYGLTVSEASDIIDQIKKKSDIDEVVKPDNNTSGIVSIVVSNVYYDSGQQTFPESGAWDLPPEWMYDINIVRYEYDSLPNAKDEAISRRDA